MRRAAFWLLTRTVATTTDADRAKRGRMMWGQIGDDVEHGIWRLRVIGVLNGALDPLGLALCMVIG